MSDEPVVVLGAGPAGLATAGLLHRRGHTPLVLERDSGPAARTQGGSLDLGERSGQRTLTALGLAAGFAAAARPQGQQFRVFDPDGTLLVDVGAAQFDESRPEIDRDALRTLLRTAVPADRIRWNAHVVDVRRDGSAWRIELAGGAVLTADTVLACDGARSPARHLVSADPPAYSGALFVSGHLPHPDPAGTVARLTGAGAMFAIGDERAILAQRSGDGSIHVYFALHAAPDFPPEGLAAAFAGFAPELRGILAEITEFTSWPLVGVPADQRWTPQPGLTLLGDAAHVMTPFTGQGVNMALLDALELATALDSAPTIDEALRSYEAEMLPRMRAAIPETRTAQRTLLNPAGAAALLAALH